MLYKEETIERMAAHFQQVLDTILSDPNRKLSSIAIISPEEKAQILETFNDTAADYPRDKTIHQLVEEQAERTLDQAAVVYEGSQLTYRELNIKANQLARTLRAEGLRPDQPVGVKESLREIHPANRLPVFSSVLVAFLLAAIRSSLCTQFEEEAVLLLRTVGPIPS
ncbi:AMP-binding protein [Paenibacillus thiaminolyticus]